MIRAMLRGENLQPYQMARPDWFEWVLHSIILEQQGSGAAQLYSFPTNDPNWRSAMMLLAFLWKEVSLQLGLNGSAAMASLQTLGKALGSFKR